MSAQPQSFQFSLRTAIVVSLMAGAVLGVFIIIYSAFRSATEGEFTLHTMSATLQIMDEHIRDKQGDWPRSWDELESIAAQSSLSGRFSLQEVKKRVKFDFGARLEDLAHQDLATFKAIRPIGPCYESSYEPHTIMLLQSIRDAVTTRAEKSPSAKGAN